MLVSPLRLAKTKETLDMVESIIAGQSTFASRIAELEGQIKATQNSITPAVSHELQTARASSRIFSFVAFNSCAC